MVGSVSTVFAQDQTASLPRFEIFGGYSVNTDFIANREVIVVFDQKVSPFFSDGSGPKGFEFSVKRYVRKNLGIKGDVSSYFDTFPRGGVTYCQPTGCAPGLTFLAKGQAYFATVGPEWKFRRHKRFAPFAQALGGIVHERATFEMAGTGVQYLNPFRGAGLIVFNSAGFPQVPNPSYSDANADTGLAFSLGGGFDIRLSRKLGFRFAMDYDPTFLVRPAIHDPTLFKTTPSERDRQGHIRMSVGFVWGIQ
jgi:hypothetical protein